MCTTSIFAAAVITLGACIPIGPKPFPPATGPQGATVSIRLYEEKTARRGELFAVDSNGVYLRASDGLTLLSWTLRFGVDVEGQGYPFDVKAGDPPEPVQRQRLASLSRFPQGMSADLLARVLAELHQPVLIHVAATRDEVMPPPGKIDTLDELAMATARATERFADQDEAVRAGYRRIGTDFPSMGEHWLNPGVLLAGRIDPDRPTILAYADVGGTPRLNGVGFVVTTHGASGSPALPGWPHAWHEHSGLLHEESGVRHGSDRATVVNDTTTRVWVLHIWTRLPNAGGKYAPDNWALPFVRLGLIAPDRENFAAASALSLLSGGDAYLRGVLGAAGLMESASRVDTHIEAARREAASVVQATSAAMAARELTSAELSRLSTIWSTLATRVTQVAGPSASVYFLPAHGSSHH